MWFLKGETNKIFEAKNKGETVTIILIQKTQKHSLHLLFSNLNNIVVTERHQQYFCQVSLCTDDNYQIFWNDNIGPSSRFL